MAFFTARRPGPLCQQLGRKPRSRGTSPKEEGEPKGPERLVESIDLARAGHQSGTYSFPLSLSIAKALKASLQAALGS